MVRNYDPSGRFEYPEPGDEVVRDGYQPVAKRIRAMIALGERIAAVDQGFDLPAGRVLTEEEVEALEYPALRDPKTDMADVSDLARALAARRKIVPVKEEEVDDDNTEEPPVVEEEGTEPPPAAKGGQSKSKSKSL